MKKIWILLVSLAITAILLFIWLQDKPTGSKVQDLEESNKLAKSISSIELETFTSQKQVDDSTPLKEGVPEEKKEQHTSNVCKEQLAKQFPALQKKFDDVISEFYMNGEQAAGEGVYQNMPLEALKPLADSNDPNAMMIYGSDMIWYSATGIRINRTESQYRTREQTKKIIENHRVDLDGVNKGEKYLFKAAVFGKVGSIFEIAILLDLVARNLDKEQTDEGTIFGLLSTSLAHKKLILDIHRNDLALRWMFSQSADPFNNIQRLYADHENYTEIKKQIEADAEILYQDLKQRWEHDREYYGFDIYPDYLQGELEEYGNAYLECYLR